MALARGTRSLPRGSLFSPSATQLSVLSYNILAPSYVRPIDKRTGAVQNFAAFEWCSDAAVAWGSRQPLLRSELLASDADVICLQEVEFEALAADDPARVAAFAEQERAAAAAAEAEAAGLTKAQARQLRQALPPPPPSYRLPRWLQLDGFASVIPDQSAMVQMAERNERVLGTPAAIGNALLYRTDRLERVWPSDATSGGGTTRCVVALLRGTAARLPALPPTAFCSVHLDATSEEKRVKRLIKTLDDVRRKRRTRNVVIAGDMNTEIPRGGAVATLLLGEAEAAAEAAAAAAEAAEATGAAIETATETASSCAAAAASAPRVEPTRSDLIAACATDLRTVAPPTPTELASWAALRRSSRLEAERLRVRLARAPTGATRAGFDHDHDSDSGDSSSPRRCAAWALDHIFWSVRTLRLAAQWSTLEADPDSLAQGLPNARCPSDHIPIATLFDVRPPAALGAAERGALEAAWRALGEEETQAINAVGGGGGGGGGGTSAGGAASKRRKKGESQKKVKKVKPSAEEIVALRLVRKQRKEVKEQFNAQRDAFVARLTALELDALEDYQMDGGGKKWSG